MVQPERWPGSWPAGAELLIAVDQVAAALDQQAARLEHRLKDHDRVTLMVLMNGGLYPSVELARRIQRPILMDHVHATRYRGATRGGDLHWGRWPSLVEGTILLVDDIFDEGYTLQAVREKLLEDGADAVITVVLALKQHQRGLPRGADMVFDCRFLRNPHWQPDLRPMDGRQPQVADFVHADPRFGPFNARVSDLVLPLLEGFVAEGKSSLTIAFGCTGGQHRSVVMAETLSKTLAEAGWQVSKRHREIERGVGEQPAPAQG